MDKLFILLKHLTMEFLATLFLYAPTPMAVFQGEDRRIQLTNPAWCQFWNVRVAPIEGLLLTDVLTVNQATVYNQLLDSVGPAGPSETIQTITITVDRDELSVERHLRVVTTLAPYLTPVCIGTIITDITETVQAQQQADRLAREQEMQRWMMREALDNSPVAIVVAVCVRDEVTDELLDFEYRLANRETNRLSSLPAGDELVGRRMLGTFPGDIDSGVFDQFKAVIETGEPLAIETHYQHGSTDRWFYVRVVKHGDGFVQTTLDITPIKEAEAAVEQQADLLRSILDNSQTAISLHNAIRDPITRQVIDFKTALANKRAREFWGDRIEQHMNQTFLTLRPEAAGTPEFDRYVQVVSSGEPAQFDYGYGDRLYSINIARAGDGIVLSSVDITSDRQYQRQLEQVNAELRRSNEGLQAFASIASHDLQEPLRKITAFSTILTSQYAEQLDVNGQAIITRMQLAAERMSALIRDLLAYARIGNQHTSFRAVDLTQLMRDLLDDMEITIQTSGATVKVESLPHLWGDPVQLRQLMQNLLSNALKFKRDDRPPIVQISSERIPISQLPATLLEPVRATQAYWLIRVTDNGIGFAPEYYDRIFEVFQRLHGRSQYSGTGIGLAIVRKVAEQHGGLVVVDSQPDVGSTFSIYLPMIE